MPRSNSTSSRSSYSRSSPTYPKSQIKQTTPAPIQNTPQTQVIQHQGPGLGSSIVSGFGWGVGTSIARSIFGGSTEQKPTIVSNVSNNETPKCSLEQNDYLSCLKTNRSGMCYEKEEILKKCLEK